MISLGRGFLLLLLDFSAFYYLYARCRFFCAPFRRLSKHSHVFTQSSKSLVSTMARPNFTKKITRTRRLLIYVHEFFQIKKKISSNYIHPITHSRLSSEGLEGRIPKTPRQNVPEFALYTRRISTRIREFFQNFPDPRSEVTIVLFRPHTFSSSSGEYVVRPRVWMRTCRIY